MNIVPWFPGVVLKSEVLPLYEVSQLSIDHPGIQNFLYHPLFFSINHFRKRRWS
jgi:hypothetical protein